jgi:hypothetical protein
MAFLKNRENRGANLLDSGKPGEHYLLDLTSWASLGQPRCSLPLGTTSFLLGRGVKAVIPVNLEKKLAKNA